MFSVFSFCRVCNSYYTIFDCSEKYSFLLLFVLQATAFTSQCFTWCLTFLSGLLVVQLYNAWCLSQCNPGTVLPWIFHGTNSVHWFNRAAFTVLHQSSCTLHETAELLLLVSVQCLQLMQSFLWHDSACISTASFASFLW